MKVIPGQPIPFWFRLWDGNASRYVVAHLTDTAGTEQSGSPFSLSYSGNRGIYVGTGPAMGNANLVADYETFLDIGHTDIDNGYLPASEWVQPDITASPPQLIFVNKPILGRITPNKIVGSVACEVETTGTIHYGKLKGFVNVPLLTGSVSTPEITEYL